MEHWTQTKDGFCTELSDLPNGGVRIHLPDTKQLVKFRDLKAHRDAENDLTHWTFQANGKTYTIFND